MEILGSFHEAAQNASSRSGIFGVLDAKTFHVALHASDRGNVITKVLVALLLASIPFGLTYLCTLFLGFRQWQATTNRKVPPTIPYALPFVGNTIAIAWDHIKFTQSAAYATTIRLCITKPC